ncbi:DUF4328 domain-containing protein [Streptomyces coerulescens]|uniref:DUF4328 domain-containing protein n=1 Tax=Streptomyces coerulescens TaxID=29304 RepID=A0ABW0CCT0_STRCD
MSASNDLRPRPQLPSGRPESSVGPLVAAVAGLALVALCDVFSLVAGFRLRAVIDGDGGFLTAGQQDLDAAASLYDTAARYQVIVYLPAAIAFIVWFFRMRRATGLMAPDRFRNGPGWAIGAWLIPLANLWMPYRIAVDMWGAATPLPAEGERFRARLWPVNLWWGLFVLSILVNRFAGTKYRNAETLAEIRDGVGQYMAADVLHVVAAAAAMYFAVRLSTMQRLKAAEGPYGPAVAKETAA